VTTPAAPVESPGENPDVGRIRDAAGRQRRPALDGNPVMAGPTRSAIVVNPTKVVDLDARRAEICAALAKAGWPEPQWLSTTPEDPGCGMTREAVDAGVDVVFAFGGDGTVMACASVLAGTDVALAILPSGTGNLLATNLGLPGDLAAGVAVATGGNRRRIDVGVVEDLPGSCFTVMAGMGFDAEMLAGTSERLKRRIGWPAYVVAALRRLTDRPARVRVRVDDGPFRRYRARSVLVGNVGRLQGGVPLLVDAEPDDGWLDVAILTPHTLGHWVALAVAVLRRQRDVPAMTVLRARRVEILSGREQSRELDGDVVSPSRHMTVTIRPAALTVCVA
jgi:YegS/Rv2252/BmrU family lipid kinase